MKRRSFAVLFVVAVILTVVSEVRMHLSRLVRSESAATLSPARHTRVARVVLDRVAPVEIPLAVADVVDSATGDDPVPAQDRAARRAELLRRESGTYIGELLSARDSALVRWPDRRDEPITVWIQPFSEVADWDSSFVQQARVAFTEWSATGIPVYFDFEPDSSRADVHLTWVDHFSESVSGKTLWARDGRYWMVDANIILATHHSGGDALDGAAIRALALHEVGHLLGMDHTADVASIMTPKVRVRELSQADRATVRLLYSLPPGSVR